MFTISLILISDVSSPLASHQSNKKRKRKLTLDNFEKIQEKIFFRKLKSLTIYIRQTYKRVYTPGIHLSINEIMIAYREQSKHTIKLLNKPISEEYKVWDLAEHSYI